MSSDVDDPTPQRRRLAALLRDLRLGSGMTGEQLGAQAGMSQSKVSKIETARQVPTVADVQAWAGAVGAPSDVHDDLVERAEAALTEASTWRHDLRHGLANLQQRIGRREQSVSTIREFEPTLVPGLLQTAEYARRVVSFGHSPRSPQEIAAAVTARLERQQVLFDESKRVELLVTEAALRWRPGSPSVLRAQLDRIDALTSLPSLSFGVIPWQGEAVDVYLHGFAIEGDPREDGEVLVIVSTLTAGLQIRDPVDVAAYLDKFARLRQGAVFAEEARALLQSVARDLPLG